MSSRRASTNAFQDELRKSRVDLRLDAHRNEVASAEAPAFYRILLGHQHEVAIRIVQILGPKGVVIGKGMGRESEPHAFESGEEPRGVADARDGVEPLARELR